MKISIVRGAFLNPYELQNYSPLKDDFDITAISSKHPISDKIDLPLKKLWSPTDFPNIPFKFQILNRLFTDAHILFGLDSVIRGSDIVHVAETYYGYTHQVIMAKRRGEIKRIISTVWETIPHNNEGIRGRKQFKKYAYENVDKFLAITNKAKAALIKEGVNEQKIEVVKLGIDTQKFKPKPKKDKRYTRILCVARLVPEKGVLDLLEAFHEIYKKNDHVWLTFIGDGPLKKDLQGYKNITVKTVPYSRIHNEYQAADIFCLPSRKTRTWEEQYGMSLIEAMATGLPVVTTDTGAIPEVCGSSAFYFKPGNKIALKKNLEYLIYNQDIRKSMGKASRALVEKEYDRQKVARRIGEIYKQIACR